MRFSWAQSVMILTASHAYPDPGIPEGGVRIGRVARKFWVREPDPFFLKRLLEPPIEALKELAHQLGIRVRDYVDQGPLPLNLYAVRSGLFWRGYNAMPNSIDYGTHVTLACLLTDILVTLPAPHPDRCGSCRQCVACCPTGALLGDRRVDLNRCISYWTTSYQELIPFEFRPAIGNWLFGCDICQDVCPWNWKADKVEWFWKGFQADPDLAYPDLTDAFALSSQDFARKYAGSAFERVGRLRVARNALVVLANTKDPAYLPLVSRAATDNAAFIRAMAAWALVNLGSRKEAERLLRDPDETVRQEAAIALERSGS
jgi:epoxyqueuosine reductase QueG